VKPPGVAWGVLVGLGSMAIAVQIGALHGPHGTVAMMLKLGTIALAIAEFWLSVKVTAWLWARWRARARLQEQVGA